MARHILGVEVIPTVNDSILHLFDSSVYSESLGVTCNRLEISVPGFRTPRLLEPLKLFNLAINGIVLDLISPETDVLPPLPDGVYHIKYSVSPNEEVYVEFDHLRTTAFDRQILKARCELNMGSCSPSEDIREDLKTLREIDDYVKAAVASVEVCEEEVEKGLGLFIYAKKLLDRYSKHC